MTTQLINFTIPNNLLRNVDKLAKKESKSRAEVLLEAARLLTRRAREKERNFRAIQESARRINMGDEEAIGFIDEIRDELQINK